MQRAWKYVAWTFGIIGIFMVVVALYQGVTHRRPIHEETQVEKQYVKVGSKKKMTELKQGSTSRQDYLDKLRYETAIGVPKSDRGTVLTATLKKQYDINNLPDGMYFYYEKGSTSSKYVKQELVKYSKTKGHYPINVFYLTVEPSYISGKEVTQKLTGKDIPNEVDRPLGYFVQNNEIVQTYKQGKTLTNLPLRY